MHTIGTSQGQNFSSIESKMWITMLFATWCTLQNPVYQFISSKPNFQCLVSTAYLFAGCMILVQLGWNITKHLQNISSLSYNYLLYTVFEEVLLWPSILLYDMNHIMHSVGYNSCTEKLPHVEKWQVVKRKQFVNACGWKENPHFSVSWEGSMQSLRSSIN